MCYNILMETKYNLQRNNIEKESKEALKKSFLETFSEYDKKRNEAHTFEFDEFGKPECLETIEVKREEKVTKETKGIIKLRELTAAEEEALKRLLKLFYKLDAPTIDLSVYYNVTDDDNFNSSHTEIVKDFNGVKMGTDYLEEMKVLPEGAFLRVGTETGNMGLLKIDPKEAETKLQDCYKNKKDNLILQDVNLEQLEQTGKEINEIEEEKGKIEKTKEKLNKELQILEKIIEGLKSKN